MIENIDKINLSDEVIDFLDSNYGYDCLLSLACNYELVNKNIDYLKSLGVKNINEIVMYKHEVVLLDTEKLVKRISKFNVPMYIQLLNLNETIIEELF